MTVDYALAGLDVAGVHVRALPTEKGLLGDGTISFRAIEGDVRTPSRCRLGPARWDLWYSLDRRRDGALADGPIAVRRPSLRRSSVVERAAVNRLVVGSSPTAGAILASWITLSGQLQATCHDSIHAFGD